MLKYLFAVQTVLLLGFYPGSVHSDEIDLPVEILNIEGDPEYGEYLASDCWVTVFPEPNGPGIPAAPPLANGNRKSRILIPVTRGVSGAYFWRNGLGDLTGHFCII